MQLVEPERTPALLYQVLVPSHLLRSATTYGNPQGVDRHPGIEERRTKRETGLTPPNSVQGRCRLPLRGVPVACPMQRSVWDSEGRPIGEADTLRAA